MKNGSLDAKIAIIDFCCMNLSVDRTCFPISESFEVA